MRYVRIDLPAAYFRQDCKLASSNFEPLFLEDKEVREIRIFSFPELTRGVMGDAPLGSLIWKTRASYKSPYGLAMRFCLICGGGRPASLTWCCGETKGLPTMAQFRAAFKDGTLKLPIFYTEELVPYIPLLNTRL